MDRSEGVALFEEMVNKSGEKPDATTFIVVLTACSHSGLIDYGIKIFNSMLQEHDVEPISDHYTCLIDSLGRAGRFNEIERAADELFRLNPCNSAPYVLLANMYSSMGRWDDIRNIRELMISKHAVKDQGEMGKKEKHAHSDQVANVCDGHICRLIFYIRSFILVRWLTDTPLMNIYPSLFALELKKWALISECFGMQNHSLVWNWRWKRAVLTTQENNDLNHLMDILSSVAPSGNKDEWRWGVISQHVFYSSYIKYKICDNIQVDDTVIFRWNNWAPKTVNIFMWQASHSRIPTLGALSRRGVAPD
ncbi:hypothetical protein QVD17_06780 [Tagetes erecta]|uniref:Reverse transcriptase zinc-binding domain-containing protein n=1 Tax=Tagetes erecta TaxID=13708 RepID=A0AAD8LE91_TARER|nr:hypothetical protein QVD17_06780 [Tagetes erecta]